MMRIVLYLLLFLCIMGSCTTQDICENDNQSELVARFKTLQESTAIDTMISGVSVYGIREGQLDSLIYNSTTTSRIVLPLDPGHDFSRFVLQINEVSDTFRCIHTSEYYMISYTCGFGMLFNLDSVRHTGWMIQDMEILNAVIDVELEQNEEHLWIYF